MNELNAVTEPSDELTMSLPWTTTVKVACQALINGRSWDEQVRSALTAGMHRVGQERREFRSMVKANKEAVHGGEH